MEGSVVFVTRETQSGAKTQGPAVDSHSLVKQGRYHIQLVDARLLEDSGCILHVLVFSCLLSAMICI